MHRSSGFSFAVNDTSAFESDEHAWIAVRPVIFPLGILEGAFLCEHPSNVSQVNYVEIRQFVARAIELFTSVLKRNKGKPMNVRNFYVYLFLTLTNQLLPNIRNIRNIKLK